MQGINCVHTFLYFCQMTHVIENALKIVRYEFLAQVASYRGGIGNRLTAKCVDIINKTIDDAMTVRGYVICGAILKRSKLFQLSPVAPQNVNK